MSTGRLNSANNNNNNSLTSDTGTASASGAQGGIPDAGLRETPTYKTLQELPESKFGLPARLATDIGTATYAPRTVASSEKGDDYGQAFMTKSQTGSDKTNWQDMTSSVDKPGGLNQVSRVLKKLSGHTPKELGVRMRENDEGNITNLAFTSQAEEYTAQIAANTMGVGSAIRAVLMARKYDEKNEKEVKGRTFDVLHNVAPQIGSGGARNLATDYVKDRPAKGTVKQTQDGIQAARQQFTQSVNERFKQKQNTFNQLKEEGKGRAEVRAQVGEWWANHLENNTTPDAGSYLTHKSVRHGIKFSTPPAPATSSAAAAAAAAAAVSDHGAASSSSSSSIMDTTPGPAPEKPSGLRQSPRLASLGRSNSSDHPATQRNNSARKMLKRRNSGELDQSKIAAIDAPNRSSTPDRKKK